MDKMLRLATKVLILLGPGHTLLHPIVSPACRWLRSTPRSAPPRPGQALAFLVRLASKSRPDLLLPAALSNGGTGAPSSSGVLAWWRSRPHSPQLPVLAPVPHSYGRGGCAPSPSAAVGRELGGTVSRRRGEHHRTAGLCPLPLVELD